MDIKNPIFFAKKLRHLWLVLRQLWLIKIATIVVGVATIVFIATIVVSVATIVVFCDNCGFLRQLWLVLWQLWLIATIVNIATIVITSHHLGSLFWNEVQNLYRNFCISFQTMHMIECSILLDSPGCHWKLATASSLLGEVYLELWPQLHY